MNIVYKMIRLGTLILSIEKNPYMTMKNKLAVSIKDFITIIYNCNWIRLIIISKTLSYTIRQNIKRRYYQCLLNRIGNERFYNKKVS